jgi:plasmid stability protein
MEPRRGGSVAVTLSIKNVPEELAERLRERAKRNHRSLQKELLAILEEAVAPKRLTLEEAYRRVKELNLRTGPESVTMVREDRDVR